MDGEENSDASLTYEMHIFQLNWMWPRLGGWFKLEKPAPSTASATRWKVSFRRRAGLGGDRPQHGLVESDLSIVASPWHTDADLGRPSEIVTERRRAASSAFTTIRRRMKQLLDIFKASDGPEHCLAGCVTPDFYPDDIAL